MSDKAIKLTQAKMLYDDLRERHEDLAEDVSNLLNEIESNPEQEDSTKTGVDLDVSDENGNVIVRFADGHIKTKHFDSSNADSGMIADSNKTGVDLDIADPSGNVVGRFSDGSFFTKKFNSRYVRQLQGIKWACMGDSLTAVNIRTTMHYHDYIAEETGITVVNLGYTGAGYAKKGGANKNFTDVVSEIPNDADVITIFGSGNDMASGLDVGTASDSGTTTMCGCINTTLDAIFNSYPTIPIGVVTPTPWIRNEPSDGNTTFSQYCSALVDICKRRGIPCLDLFHCSNLHPDSETFRELAYSKDEGDGVHPDETGHAIITPRIREFLFTLV